MAPSTKNAWITFAIDEKTSEEAILLANSLRNVVTLADIVILTSYEVFKNAGENLSKHFDVVLPQPALETSNLSEMDMLKVFACNLQIFSKCIILNPTKRILKNCDELFSLESNFAATVVQDNPEAIDYSVLALSPSYPLFKAIYARAECGNFLSFSDIFNNLLEQQESGDDVSFQMLPSCYNYQIQKSALKYGLIDEAKIFDAEAGDFLRNNLESIPLSEVVLKTLEKIQNFSESQLKLKQSMFSKKNSRNDYKDSIAVVGHSCRFPGANNSEEFWDLINSGGDGIRQVPTERLSDFQRNDSKFTESKAGFLKCPIDEFDAKFFGISPREATFMDPQQRLLLEVAWEALENAAINPHSLKNSNTGVFTGVWTHDYEKLVVESGSAQDFHHVILGNAFSATSARVSYFLGLNGPNIAVESGCSSSMVGLHLACDSLRKGETDLSLVLGANILVINLPYSVIPILANDGHCKTFDEKADGFGRAEGVAVIVLKRLSDAIKSGDRIMGIIRGSALSNEGTTSSFGTPSKHCQEIAVKQAIINASIDPNDVDYVEAHGTGTPVGDPIEFAALAAAYASPDRKNPLVVGSVKTNTGHTESAAGLAGVIKVLLSMKHEIIPPHRNFDTLNPNIDLNIIPSIIPIEPQKWERNAERVRMAGVSSFGISGTNAHAILEEPPKLEWKFIKEKGVNNVLSNYILPLSAKSENGLYDLCTSYIEYLEQDSTVNLGDLTFTAATGRAHFKHRIAIVGSEVKEMIMNLKNMQKELFSRSTSKPKFEKPKVAFLFSGQGSQYVGMGQDLYESNIVFRSAFDECETLLESHGISLKTALWSEHSNKLLEQTMYSQLSIFAIEYALLKLWNSFGITPDFVLGHSVGEFAASVAAGILSFQDALYLIIARSRLIEYLPVGGMLAVKSSKTDVEKMVSEFSLLNPDPDAWIDIAAVNSSEETVVAGNKDAIDLFEDFCKNRNKKFSILAATRAFHSRAINAIEKEFFTFGETISHEDPNNIVYISGTTGKVILPGEIDTSYWCRHARQTVNFDKGMDTLFENGCNIFIEIGSHPILLAFGMTNQSLKNESIWLPSMRKNADSWNTLLQSLADLYINGVDINWQSLQFPDSRKKLELPTYPFQRQKYWINSKVENFVPHVHPLLGRKLALANQINSIYENSLNLKDFPYLKDHQMVNITIFPGAAFLEIILAAGNHLLLKNKFSTLSVENFTIEAPFELDLDRDYRMQVVASPFDGNSNKMVVKVFSFQALNGYNDEKGWRRYAEATVDIDDGKYDETSTEIFHEIKQRYKNEYNMEEVYKHISEIGINFAENFQSIKTIWKGANEALAEIPAFKDNNSQGYIFHPIVLDAMFQLFGLNIDKNNLDLHLPVSVEKFTLFSMEKSQKFFAHAVWEAELSNGRVSLYDENNVLLTVMKGIRLVRTSVNSFLNVINSQRNTLPGMYHEVWRSRDGPLQFRIDLSGISLDNQDILRELKEVMKDEMEDFKTLLPLYTPRYDVAHCMKVLLNLGWKPTLLNAFTPRSFIVEYGISINLECLLSNFFEVLSDSGYLAKDSSTDEWVVSTRIPDLNEINETLKEFDEILAKIEMNRNKTHVVTHILKYCVSQFNDIAFEKITPQNVLCGNGDPTLNAYKIYTEGEEINCANIRSAQYIRLLFKQICKMNSESVLRILEIGAGSGASSKEIMERLKMSGIPFRYCFTDISSHVVNEAKVNFSDTDHIEFRVLDIEKDPLSQGFAPYHYDVVIAANVIHATSKLRNSIGNIRLLVKQEGILLLQEILRPIMAFDMIFGIMTDYWKFNDYDIRLNHPCASKDIWDNVFLDTGFSSSVNISEDFELVSVLVTQALPIKNFTMDVPPNTQPSTWVLECDNDGHYVHLSEMLKSIGRQVCLIKGFRDCVGGTENTKNCFYINSTAENEIENCLDTIFERYTVEGCCLLRGISDYDFHNQRSICFTSIHFVRQLLSRGSVKRGIHVVTSGVYNVGNQKTMHPYKATLAGLMKTASNEAAHLTVKLIEIDPDTVNVSSKSNAAEIFYELFCGTDELCCYRRNKKFVMRFCQMEKSNSMITLPRGRYTVAIPSSKKISDVQFRSATKLTLKPNEVEILVKATALNFRDLFVILKPEMFKSQFESVGTDFSGIITDIGSSVRQHKVGDQIFGISHNSCAASHVVVDEHFIQAKPENYTFSEACTIPSVFLTAYFCLVTTAKLNKNETVLIHVASGGVGLVAIQIAQQIGANIIATAGSHRKRAYLRSLGIKYVFHSRDLTFEKEINKATNGKGVDVVLNSLTGPGFKESTLRVCAQNARFLEIGKVNIWTPEEVLHLRPDVSYNIIDLEVVDDVTTKHLVSAMKNYVSTNLCRLPFSRFPITQIKDALNYFAKSEHIGKIVLTMPDFKETEQGHYCNDLTFSSQGTYLVTGGLRGIGLEVAKWLVDCGAKNIILVARSPPDENALKVLKEFRNQGCRVKALMVDVGDLQQCTLLFDTIKSANEKWPPLKGIIHSAGVVSDATLINQTWEKFDEVFNSKVRGGWNLHNLSKDLLLEHFVVFSSIAAILGAPGQSNYSAANMFLDSLIHYRHSIGLPGQTINWGTWGKIGTAAETDQRYCLAPRMGVMAFTPAQGIAALKYIMSRPNLKQISVVQLDQRLLGEAFGDKDGFLSELFSDSNEYKNGVSNSNSETFWNEINPLNFQERVAYIKKHLEKIIRKTLKVPETEQLDEFTNFSEMGLDSLMAVEMKNKMQNVIGKQLTLTATSLLDHPTIYKLSHYLAEQTSPINISKPESFSDKSQYEVDYELIRQDSILPSEIKSVTSFCIHPSLMKSILVTGASGRLGMYVLKDLLEIPSLSIVCLLRGKNIEQARRKLLANLKKAKLETFVNLERVSIVIGNVAEKNLGLSQEIYDSLSSQIDCVVHLAIKSNHVEKYKMAKTGVSDIRSVNVLGTINILRFCYNIKTKRVFYSSSYSAVNRLTDEGFIYEDFPDEENNADNISMGYILTKFVCEKLLRQANERGIPCTVVRYLELTGDSQTGVFYVENNSLMNIMLLSIRCGIVPQIPGGWCFMPVDVASKLTLELLFNDNAESGVYNFTPPLPIYSNDFIEIFSEFGYKSVIESAVESFQDTIMKDKENNSWLSVFTESYGSDLKTALLSTTYARSNLKDKREVYCISKKLLNVLPNFYQMTSDTKIAMRQYLQYAHASGILKISG